MGLDFLPNKIYSALNKVNMDKLNEIRLRLNLPIICKYEFKKYFLSDLGLTLNSEKSILADELLFEEIIKNITELSLYAHNERLKNCYLVSKSGERIGIAGECVIDNQVVTVKNITSMLIRVPHDIIGCADKVKEHIFNGKGINNILIISPPGFGKTTLIKDIIRLLALNNKDVLVIDERGELFNKSTSVDYIRFSSKKYAFEKGIRSLSPEVIVTDELIDKEDFVMCQNAVCSGLSIIASVHASKIEEVLSKDYPTTFFDKYIILNNLKKAGEIKYVYDRHNINL